MLLCMQKSAGLNNRIGKLFSYVTPYIGLGFALDHFQGLVTYASDAQPGSDEHRTMERPVRVLHVLQWHAYDVQHAHRLSNST